MTSNATIEGKKKPMKRASDVLVSEAEKQDDNEHGKFQSRCGADPSSRREIRELIDEAREPTCALARQRGESMILYVKRRNTWWERIQSITQERISEVH